EQLLASDPDETVSGGALARALEDKLDIVPVIEGVRDLLRALGVGGAHRLHHRVGKDDAPAEGVVRLVAFDDGDGVFRVSTFHQQTEIEPGRSSADTD